MGGQQLDLPLRRRHAGGVHGMESKAVDERVQPLRLALGVVGSEELDGVPAQAA